MRSRHCHDPLCSIFAFSAGIGCMFTLVAMRHHHADFPRLSCLSNSRLYTRPVVCAHRCSPCSYPRTPSSHATTIPHHIPYPLHNPSILSCLALPHPFPSRVAYPVYNLQGPLGLYFGFVSRTLSFTRFLFFRCRNTTISIYHHPLCPILLPRVMHTSHADFWSQLFTLTDPYMHA